MTYETMDWELEAKRLKVVFEIDEECEFFVQPPEWHDIQAGETMQLWHESGIERLNVEAFGEFEFEAIYSPNSRIYRLSTPSEYGSIEILWDGLPVLSVYRYQLNHFLACPLFHLGLLTPEVEAALQVSISSHQKLEWQLEYEKRVGTAK